MSSVLNDHRITIRLPHELRRELDDLAQRLDVTTADLLREGARLVLDTQASAEPTKRRRTPRTPTRDAR